MSDTNVAPVGYSAALSASLGGISNLGIPKGYFVGNFQLGIVTSNGHYNNSYGKYQMVPSTMHLLDLNLKAGKIDGNFTVGYAALFKTFACLYPGVKVFYGHLENIHFGAIAPTVNLMGLRGFEWVICGHLG